MHWVRAFVSSSALSISCIFSASSNSVHAKLEESSLDSVSEKSMSGKASELTEFFCSEQAQKNRHTAIANANYILFI